MKRPVAEDRDDAGRGSVAGSTEPRFLAIGRVGRPHGLRGEVRVTPITDVPERFTWLKMVYVGETAPRPVEVESARLHGEAVLLKLVGVDDREAAEGLRSEWLQVPEEEGIPLEEGEYYLYQLIGLNVYTDSDEHLGEIVEVLETNANNVFVVRGLRGEILLPDIEDVIQAIDFEGGRMTVTPLPGLLP